MANENQSPAINWQARAYLISTVAGVVLGVLSGYLYTQAASEHAERDGKPPEPGTLELLTIVGALLALMRQVTELGKPERKK